MKTLLFIFLLSLKLAEAAPNIPLEKGVGPPTKLSQTGVFPSKESIPYQIVQSLWVDYALKNRTIYLPPGQKITFSPREAYTFPVGTILVKHFQMEISKSVFQNIETRVLVRKEGEHEQNWEGYTYQWSGDDAILVANNVAPQVILDVDATAAGGARRQTFTIPTRGQCLQCHNGSVGFVRSFETRQLNLVTNGRNQLEELAKANIFNIDIGHAQQYDSFAAIQDESRSLEERAKTYLTVNCAHCHNPSPLALCSFTGLDFRFDFLNPEALIKSGHVVKGLSSESDLFQRMDSLRRGLRMPYIGSALRDESALKIIAQWIDEM